MLFFVFLFRSLINDYIANLICQACKMQIIKNLHDYTMDLNDEMMGFDDFLGRTKKRDIRKCDRHVASCGCLLPSINMIDFIEQNFFL